MNLPWICVDFCHFWFQFDLKALRGLFTPCKGKSGGGALQGGWVNSAAHLCQEGLVPPLLTPPSYPKWDLHVVPHVTLVAASLVSPKDRMMWKDTSCCSSPV